MLVVFWGYNIHTVSNVETYTCNGYEHVFLQPHKTMGDLTLCFG